MSKDLFKKALKHLGSLRGGGGANEDSESMRDKCRQILLICLHLI